MSNISIGQETIDNNLSPVAARVFTLPNCPLEIVIPEAEARLFALADPLLKYATELPSAEIVKKIILVGQALPDADKTIGAASAKLTSLPDQFRITLANPENLEDSKKLIAYQWSKALWSYLPRLSQQYNSAVDIELADSSHTMGVNERESNWASLLLGAFLQDDQNKFMNLCRLAPIRLTILGAAIGWTLLNIGQKSRRFSAYQTLVDHIQTKVQPLAISALLEQANNATASDVVKQSSLKLLMHLADKATVDRVKTIDKLDFSYEYISEQELAKVVGRSDLKSLDLSHAKISLDTLEQLKELKTIEKLVLSSTATRDNIVRLLEKHETLKQLALDATATTDYSIIFLFRLTSLEELDLRHTEFTAEGINVLKQDLPNCQILSSHIIGASSGT